MQVLRHIYSADLSANAYCTPNLFTRMPERWQLPHLTAYCVQIVSVQKVEVLHEIKLQTVEVPDLCQVCSGVLCWLCCLLFISSAECHP